MQKSIFSVFYSFLLFTVHLFMNDLLKADTLFSMQQCGSNWWRDPDGYRLAGAQVFQFYLRLLIITEPMMMNKIIICCYTVLYGLNINHEEQVNWWASEIVVGGFCSFRNSQDSCFHLFAVFMISQVNCVWATAS